MWKLALDASIRKESTFDLLEAFKYYAQEDMLLTEGGKTVQAEILRRMVNGERADRGLKAMTPEEEQACGFN